MSTPQVSGTIVCGIRGLMREQLRAGVYERMLELLPSPVRNTFESLTPMAWMPVHDFNLTYVAAARALDRSSGEVAKELAREGVARTLNTVWRVLLRFTSDEALTMRTPILYAKTFDTGKAESAFQSGRRARMVVTGWPEMPELSVLTLGVGVEAVFAMAGRPDARVQPRRTSDGAEYTISW